MLYLNLIKQIQNTGSVSSCILTMSISKVSLMGTLVNSFSKSNDINISFCGVYKWWIYKNSLVELILYFVERLGMVGLKF